MKIILKDIFILTLLAFFLPLFSQKVEAVGQITNVIPQKTAVGRYEKFEVTFELTSSYDHPDYFYDPNDTPSRFPNRSSPYGIDGVTVDAHFLPPGASSEIVVPAFWYVPYQRLRSGSEILGANGKGRWAVRFAPTVVGTYRYYLTAQDKGGNTQSSEKTFTVASSAKKGFIRVSPRDPRYFEFETGSSFIPIGAFGTWMGNSGSYFYEDLFDQWRQNGINFTRIWDQNDGYNLTLEGTYFPWEPPSYGWETGRAIIINNGLQGVGNPYQGKRSALFRSDTSTTQGYYQRVVVNSGTQYRLSGYIKGDGISGQAFISAGASGISDPGSIRTPTVSGTTNWQRVETIFTASSNTTGIWVGGSGQGNAQFDEIILEPTSGENYNVITDGGFEDRFTKDDDTVNNSPEQSIVVETLPMGTDINQNAAFQIDKIIEAAEKNDVYIQLCSHGDPYWSWHKTVYNESYDAWAQRFHITDSGTNPEYLNYWKRNFRYRVARWGYSTAILAWERWNEHGHILPESEAYKFYQAYGQYQQATDPFHHLRTTSQGSQNYSPSFWSSPAMDIANYHDYLMPSRYSAELANDEVNFISKFSNCLRYTDGRSCGLGLGDGSSWSGDRRKPWIWAEIGLGGNDWNVPADCGDSNSSTNGCVVFTHNYLWAGLFSPLGMTPIDWYGDSATDEHLVHAKIIASFFNGIDYAGMNFKHYATASLGGHDGTISTTNGKLDVLALVGSAGQNAYVWIHHHDNTWKNYNLTKSLESGSITLTGLTNGNFTAEWWDTYNGSIIKTEVKTASGGNLQLTLPRAIRDDLAIKITSTSLPPPVVIPGDLNSDNVVNILDLVIVGSNFGKDYNNAGTDKRADANGDRVINILDLVIVGSNFGKNTS